MTVGKDITLDSSLKRLAWAYGCAKKGSEDEANLGELLLIKASRTLEIRQRDNARKLEAT